MSINSTLTGCHPSSTGVRLVEEYMSAGLTARTANREGSFTAGTQSLGGNRMEKAIDRLARKFARSGKPEESPLYTRRSFLRKSAVVSTAAACAAVATSIGINDAEAALDPCINCTGGCDWCGKTCFCDDDGAYICCARCAQQNGATCGDYCYDQSPLRCWAPAP